MQLEVSPAWREALWSSVRYNIFILKHIAVTVMAGGLVGILPFAYCLQSTAESLVSEPRNDTASMFPGTWEEHDRVMVNWPCFFCFWLLKNIWCAIAEYIPILLALQAGGVNTRIPKVLAISGVVAVTLMETLPVWWWAYEPGSYREDADTVIVAAKYVMMLLINSASIFLAEIADPPESWLSIFLPIGVLTAMPVGIHMVQEVAVELYLQHRTWHMRILISMTIMNVVRPLLVEVVLAFSYRLASCRSDESQSRLSAYVGVSCSALVQVLQVSSDNLGETVVVYIFMMVSEVFRNLNYLQGQTELRKAMVISRNIFGRLRKLLKRTNKRCSSKDSIRSGQHDRTSPVPSSSGTSGQSGQSESSRKVSSISEDLAADIRTISESRLMVTGDLVAICNILECSMIAWTGQLFLMVQLSPYEVAGLPLSMGVIVANCLVGLCIEALADFVGFAWMSYTASWLDIKMFELYNERIGMKANGYEFIWLFTVVLSIAMETVGHMYEELCPIPEEGTTVLKSLSVCPD